MKQKLIDRLNAIKKEEKGFTKDMRRWKPVMYDDQHISDIDFSTLTDDQLIDFLEKVTIWRFTPI